MKLFLSVLLLILAGCVSNRPIVAPPVVVVTRPVVTGEIVSYSTLEQELRPLMFTENEPQIVLMDSSFGCISEEATRRIISEAFLTFDLPYIVQAADCDDSAIEMTVVLRHFFRRDTNYVPLAAPIGIIGVKLVSDIPDLGYFLGGEVAYHAVVLARCAGGKYLVIDPATKKVSEFTQYLYGGEMELILVIF